MTSKIDYIALNRDTWNERTAIHLNSDFYNLTGFLEGESSLNDIETQLLGNIKGKRILHLQCHFGQDSISLSRLGAVVTGADLSDKAIAEAKVLANKTKTAASFVCSDLYELPNVLDEKFDLVYTSYGTVGWLPDVGKWAEVIAHFLKPGGKLIFVEFHPVVWMFDNDFKHIAYNYFNGDPIIEESPSTYTDGAATTDGISVSWNHGMGEVVTALLESGLSVQHMEEFDYSPYNCFKHSIEVAPKKYRIEHLGNKIPMVYAITAVKRHPAV
jgi:2-polyprenyl-3-methyl-5-hydroxy-6-metoxy-1,4-benzoquinol methylase